MLLQWKQGEERAPRTQGAAGRHIQAFPSRLRLWLLLRHGEVRASDGRGRPAHKSPGQRCPTGTPCRAPKFGASRRHRATRSNCQHGECPGVLLHARPGDRRPLGGGPSRPRGAPCRPARAPAPDAGCAAPDPHLRRCAEPGAQGPDGGDGPQPQAGRPGERGRSDGPGLVRRGECSEQAARWRCLSVAAPVGGGAAVAGAGASLVLILAVKKQDLYRSRGA